MKIRVAALVFTAAFLLQGTLLNIVDFWGATPNLILCLVIALTFLYENEHAIYLGVAFGLLGDICFSDMAGISSLGYLAVGFIIVKHRNSLNKEALVSPIILGIAGTFLFNSISWATRLLLGNPFDFLQFLKLQPLYMALNVMVMVLLYFALINHVVKHRSDRYYR